MYLCIRCSFSDSLLPLVAPELKTEFIAREVIKRIQNLRKESGFNITDRIDVTISDVEGIADAVNTHMQFICSQVLANSITIGETTDAQYVEIDGMQAKIKVEKA